MAYFYFRWGQEKQLVVFPKQQTKQATISRVGTKKRNSIGALELGAGKETEVFS